MWASKAEAVEAMEALTHAVAKLSGGGKKLASSTRYIHYERAGHSFLAKRRGDASGSSLEL